MRQDFGTGLPLGLRSHEERAHTILIEENSLLVLYTDGLTEANHAPLDDLARLRAIIAKIRQIEDRGLAKSIASNLLSGHSPDDVAVMTISFLASTESMRRWVFDARDGRQAHTALADYLAWLVEQRWVGDEQAAILVFLELIGNVVKYTPGSAEIVLEGSNKFPVLHVLDRGDGFTHSQWLAPADLMSEGGRGLFLIATFTEEFLVTRRHGGGSHARAILSMRRAA